jgi:hypothetical protein
MTIRNISDAISALDRGGRLPPADSFDDYRINGDDWPSDDELGLDAPTDSRGPDQTVGNHNDFDEGE